MSDGPRGRRPFAPSGEYSGRSSSKSSGGNRRDEGRRDSQGRDSQGSDRGNSREGGFQERGSARGGAFQDRGPHPFRREPRSSSPQTIHRRAVHYQVVVMDEEEWGDALEQRLNSLGHDGWRLVAIDEGRQYVFMHTD